MNNRLIKYTLILILVGALAAGILALVYGLTLGPIRQHQKDLLLSSQKTVLPEAQTFETKKMFYGSESGQEYFIGLKNKKNIGVIFKVFPKGYGGPIVMLVGLDVRGRVAGVKILEQKETPGLGNHIEDEKFKNTGRPFVAQFAGKSAADKIEAKVDIDAITGATISTKAVAAGVRQALELFEIYRREQ